MITDGLTVFAAVVEQRNFSRAAELLHLSQPGVSMHIRNLEREFGARLLNRSPKSVVPTEAGEMLYKRAKQMLSLYAEAKREIALLQHEVTGRLQIGASFTIGEYVLPRLLADYARLYPQADVQVKIANTEDIVQGVAGGSLDIGLVEGSVTHPELNISSFMEDDMVLISAPDHPLATLRSVRPSLLQDEVWVLRESGSGTRSFSDRFIADHELRLKRSFVLSSSQGVKEAVAAGLGIALLSKWVVRKELEHGEVSRIALEGERLARSFSVIERDSSPLSLPAEMLKQQLDKVNRGDG